jgi:hypothetical protein
MFYHFLGMLTRGGLDREQEANVLDPGMRGGAPMNAQH